MKNKIYPFLLGLSCIVIVALVSFKNGEKAVDKEQMIIMAKALNAKTYELFISTGSRYEKVDKPIITSENYNYSDLLHKIEEYQKEGWIVTNSMSMPNANISHILCYTLEREKK